APRWPCESRVDSGWRAGALSSGRLRFAPVSPSFVPASHARPPAGTCSAARNAAARLESASRPPGEPDGLPPACEPRISPRTACLQTVVLRVTRIRHAELSRKLTQAPKPVSAVGEALNHAGSQHRSALLTPTDVSPDSRLLLQRRRQTRCPPASLRCCWCAC